MTTPPAVAAPSDVMQSQAALPPLPEEIARRLKLDQQGLVAAVIQQHDTGEVLMLGWMDPEALRRTLGTGRVTFWSRSRQEYWRKGDTSGHRQYVKSVALDCDGDALLVEVEQIGPACHTGTRTCFTGRDLPAVVGAPQRDTVPEQNAAPEQDAAEGTEQKTAEQHPDGRLSNR